MQDVDSFCIARGWHDVPSLFREAIADVVQTNIADSLIVARHGEPRRLEVAAPKHRRANVILCAAPTRAGGGFTAFRNALSSVGEGVAGNRDRFSRPVKRAAPSMSANGANSANGCQQCQWVQKVPKVGIPLTPWHLGTIITRLGRSTAGRACRSSGRLPGSGGLPGIRGRGWGSRGRRRGSSSRPASRGPRRCF